MSLLDLPNELLQQIISDSRPDGIEALVRTCKQVYEAAGPLLEDHFLTKLHFSALVDAASKRVNAKPGDKWYIRPVKVYEPSKAALAIRERPLAGEYVKELEFSETDDSGMVQNNLSGEFEDIPGHEELLAILESSDCIQSAYQYSEDFEPPNELELQNEPESYAERHALLWRTAILKGNASAMFGLLLTLLPNVRGIVFSETDPHHSRFIGPFIEAAVADEKNCGILSKLETFEINGNCTIHDLSPYLALPSIKTLKIMSIWEGAIYAADDLVKSDIATTVANRLSAAHCSTV
jgi:hypothetical protein